MLHAVKRASPLPRYIASRVCFKYVGPTAGPRTHDLQPLHRAIESIQAQNEL